jgi:hypothetical protein
VEFNVRVVSELANTTANYGLIIGRVVVDPSSRLGRANRTGRLIIKGQSLLYVSIPCSSGRTDPMRELVNFGLPLTIRASSVEALSEETEVEVDITTPSCSDNV